MPNCTQAELTFPSFDRRKIEGSFTGGEVTSDAGILLLREADRRVGLTAALDEVLADPRHPLFIQHRQVDLLRQRIYGLALGYEDLNDHDTLRHDVAWQTAVERGEALASSPTLCRLEQRVDRKAALAFHRVLLEKFIASFAEPPTELILDFDATDDRVHGTMRAASQRRLSFQLVLLGRHIGGTAYGLLPTPLASDARGQWGRKEDNLLRNYLPRRFGGIYPHPSLLEAIMGFPFGSPSETPSSRRSRRRRPRSR